jgi:hypothetical protein
MNCSAKPSVTEPHGRVIGPAPVGACVCTLCVCTLCVCTLCVPNFMPWRPFADFKSVHVRFVVYRVALCQVFRRALRSFLVSIILSVLRLLYQCSVVTCQCIDSTECHCPQGNAVTLSVPDSISESPSATSFQFIMSFGSIRTDVLPASSSAPADQLAACSTVPSNNLTVPQPVKKFTVFYKTQMFITVFTTS